VRELRYFFRHYRLQSFIVLAWLLVASALEGLGISMLLPVLGLLFSSPSGDAAATVEMSPLAESVGEALSFLGLSGELSQLIPLVVAIFWLKAIVVIVAKYRVGYTVAKIATDLRLELLRSLMAARWHHFTRLRPGAAANALATESERASLSYQYLIQAVQYAIETVIFLALAIGLSWKITIGAGATAIVTLVGLNALVRMSGRAGRKQTKYLKSLLTRLTDSLQAAKLLKSTGREGLIGPLLESDTQRLNVALRKRVFSRETLRALQEPILVSFLSAMFAIGLTMQMPMPEVTMLAFVFARIMGSSNKMQRRFQLTVTESSALWSLREMIDTAHDEVEPILTGVTPTLERGIELRDVTVKLDSTVVFENLNLKIEAGGITAIVGGSGSGKTTAVDLVTGMVRPDSGEVYLDGVPLSESDLRGWREQIGYVPQEMLMLHDSIAMNVSLGDPEITTARIEQALRDAEAWEFVSAFPEGLEYSVGERGSRLSGGQRQRISIARALVHGAKLLILDEATAALDPVSENAVWSAIKRLRGKTTVIAISHQPALMRFADTIYRIADGKCVEIEAPNHSERVVS
jgi:ATP-binding cassette subfamily C protein